MDACYGSLRGVDPATLLSLVENTVPFLFRDRAPLTPYTEIVLGDYGGRVSHFDYFALCLASHYTTVATFVPTDVDNQIRKNLWDQPLPKEVLAEMAALTLRSLSWDFRPYTTRVASRGGKYLSGHQGEWFSVAVGAYGAHRELDGNVADEFVAAILTELNAEAEIFRTLRLARDGVGLLRAATLIAHNLGDLDRVIDQWSLPADDALRVAVYKLGHEEKKSFGPLQVELLKAGALNKAMMASENHRHYPLRKPKCLRRSIDLLLPTGPFFDEWGETVARHPLLTVEEVTEVVEALLEGFSRLSSPKIPLYGYARALGGIQRAFRGGAGRLYEELPSRAAKVLQRGEIAEINRLGREAFEQQWAKKALHLVAG